MFMEIVEKAGVNGIVAATASALYFGMTPQVAGILDGTKTIPLYVLAGLVGATGSVVGDGLHYGLKETVPISQKANDRLSVITGVGVNAVAFAGLLYLYQPEILADYGMYTAMVMGGASEFAGSAAYTYLKENEYF